MSAETEVAGALSYENSRIIPGMPFSEYLKVPGASFSSVKGAGRPPVEVTDKMRFGSLVDAILTEPGDADMNSHLYPAAKVIAARLREVFPGLEQAGQRQVAAFATAKRVVEGGAFLLEVKGRLDLLIPGHAVIDYKVTHQRHFVKTVQHFRYTDQLWHYARLAGVGKAYLVAYAVPTRSVEVLSVNVAGGNTFWSEAVAQYGTYRKGGEA